MIALPRPPAPRRLFSRPYGRSAFLQHSLLWPLRVLMEKRTARHLADGRRQLVVFSFDHIGHTINMEGVYEKDELDTFFAWTRSLGLDFRGATALDVGANIGNHSLCFSDHFARVVAFEPNPRTFKVLSLNAELAPNVECRNVGLSESRGQAVLAVDPTNMGGSSITGAVAPGKGQVIDLVDLDSLDDAFHDVKLLKLDVEGHELQALSGAKALIRRQQPLVLFEQHVEDFRDGRSPVVSLLQELGYDTFAAVVKHPRVEGGGLRKLVMVPLMRLLVGESREVVTLPADIPPGFYSFIVAVPGWLKARLG